MSVWLKIILGLGFSSLFVGCLMPPLLFPEPGPRIVIFEMIKRI